jgi:hypothetical protein
MNTPIVNNPFEHNAIVNDKTVDIVKIETLLDEFRTNMKNKKKWCIDFWITNEG